ncbi:MAG: sugar ABC transporter permease [Spirochaetales bacterium]|jgi:putative aldouronate transport system permease protein|nr:sugar ABC transporter permease [Spirochaetales bacterium]
METTRADGALDGSKIKSSKGSSVTGGYKVTKTSVRLRRAVHDHWQLYLYLVIPMIYIIIFKYVPMYGVIIAFKEYRPRAGIWGSPWIGLSHFRLFLSSYQFKRVLLNTLGISIYSLLAGFPFPIILALSLNEVRSKRFKKSVQMISYLPHFISVVIFVGIIYRMLALDGIVNMLLVASGAEPIIFMNDPKLFKSIFVWSGVWQGVGYGSIIYLASLSSVNVDLYDAGRIDGMNLFQKIWHIDIPAIMPTIIILFILAAAKMMNVGFEKVYLLQNNNPFLMSTSEVISTYVYKVGLLGGAYSFGTAVGLFTSIINMILLVTINQVARKVSETSLW